MFDQLFFIFMWGWTGLIKFLKIKFFTWYSEVPIYYNFFHLNIWIIQTMLSNQSSSDAVNMIWVHVANHLVILCFSIFLLRNKSATRAGIFRAHVSSLQFILNSGYRLKRALHFRLSHLGVSLKSDRISSVPLYFTLCYIITTKYDSLKRELTYD